MDREALELDRGAMLILVSIASRLCVVPRSVVSVRSVYTLKYKKLNTEDTEPQRSQSGSQGSAPCLFWHMAVISMPDAREVI